MLKKFSVMNYGLYDEKVTLDLGKIRDFPCNGDMIKDGIVNQSVFYDNTLTCDSHFGRAIFDIVYRLTDCAPSPFIIKQEYTGEIIEFEYLFSFDGVDVEYNYKRCGCAQIEEVLIIDGQEIVNTKVGAVYNNHLQLPSKKIEGSDLWVKNIGEFIDPEKCEINKVYAKFLSFVKKMLYIDNQNMTFHIGLVKERQDMWGYLCEEERHKDLMPFLWGMDMPCDLIVLEEQGNKILFDKKSGCNFAETASSGTLRAIMLFFWLQRMKELGGCSFFYISRFDVYYHQLVSSFLFELLKEGRHQFMCHCGINTGLVSKRYVRPDCCIVLNDKEIISLDEATGHRLRTVHNWEKVFRSLFCGEGIPFDKKKLG